jgi:uncharacterized membrane protein YkvA (DUF1232 family)
MNLASWKQWARTLKREVIALYLAARDPRTPWYARAAAAVVAAYALSPIDLIPDPIPVLGYLDDLVLVPLGIALVIRMIPTDVLQDCRRQAQEVSDRPVGRVAAVVIVLLWITAVALVLVWMLR